MTPLGAVENGHVICITSPAHSDRTLSLETPFLLGPRRISICRGTILSGIVGAVGFLSLYFIALGFRNNNLLYVAFGMYGAKNVFKEAGRLSSSLVTTACRYEEGTLLNQIYLLFFNLFVQPCITFFYPARRNPHQRAITI